MPRILIVYSTTDGHTLKICQRLQQAVEPSGAQVHVVPVADADGIDLGAYRLFDRLMIRFIMLITRGPTDPRAVIEFTDWNEVEAFGRRLAQM